MPNLAPSARLRTRATNTARFDSVRKKIELLEMKIRSNYEVGDIRVRTTGKVSQSIWSRVDYLEFDKKNLSPMKLKSTESKLLLKFFSKPQTSKAGLVTSEDKGFLYCRYKYTHLDSQKKLILVEKRPILMASGRSRKKIIKALNMLSEILGCSKELNDISSLLNLFWQIGFKT